MVALVVKNPLANAGEVRDTGSIPVGVKRLRGERLKPNTVGPALALLQNVYLVMM